jgi:ABC-2 type transport system permease protein
VVNRARFLAVARKELRQILRDRLALLILFFVPVFLLLMFSYAISLDVKHVRFGVFDQDKTPFSRSLIRDFQNSGYFDLVSVVGRADDFQTLMKEEYLKMGLVIPLRLEADLLAGRPVTMQVLLDGSNSNTAAGAMGYAQGILGASARRLAGSLPAGAMAQLSAPQLEVRSRVWFNPELKSAMYLVPGLIAIILIITAVISTALSIVREKERNTIEQLVVSPVRGLELVCGKLLPYFFIACLLTVFILVVSYIFFGVAVKGSLALLAVLTVLFLFGCLGLGLMISTIAESQQVAFMIAALATLLPSYLLSGFVFPIRNMPAAIQIFTYFVPTRYFISGLRAIVLRGAGWDVVWPELLFLAGFAGLVLRASMARLKRSNIG